MKSMETKVNVTFTITKREGETDAEAKERLLSLMDSELCHLADHDIQAETANTINVKDEILNKLDRIRKVISEDMIGFDVKQGLFRIFSFIQNEVSGFTAICDGELLFDPDEETYVSLIVALKSLIGLLDWTIDPTKFNLINDQLDEAADILWDY